MLSSDAVGNDGWGVTSDSGVGEALSEYVREPDTGISGEECPGKRGPEKVSVAGAQWAGEEFGEVRAGQALDAISCCELGQDADL